MIALCESTKIEILLCNVAIATFEHIVHLEREKGRKREYVSKREIKQKSARALDKANKMRKQWKQARHKKTIGITTKIEKELPKRGKVFG